MLVVAHSTHLPNEPGGHEFDIATAEATGKKVLHCFSESHLLMQQYSHLFPSYHCMPMLDSWLIMDPLLPLPSTFTGPYADPVLGWDTDQGARRLPEMVLEVGDDVEASSSPDLRGNIS